MLGSAVMAKRYREANHVLGHNRQCIDNDEASFSWFLLRHGDAAKAEISKLAQTTEEINQKIKQSAERGVIPKRCRHMARWEPET